MGIRACIETVSRLSDTGLCLLRKKPLKLYLASCTFELCSPREQVYDGVRYGAPAAVAADYAQQNEEGGVSKAPSFCATRALGRHCCRSDESDGSCQLPGLPRARDAAGSLSDCSRFKKGWWCWRAGAVG